MISNQREALQGREGGNVYAQFSQAFAHQKMAPAIGKAISQKPSNPSKDRVRAAIRPGSGG